MTTFTANLTAMLMLLAIAIATHATAQPAQPATVATEPAAAPSVMEKIVVSGEQPGPGMWKVSKGDNVLWIVGTQTPLPQKMVWRAKGVEAIVAQAQEVLTEPSIQVSSKQLGFFTTIFLIPSAMESRKNPDGATLRDVLPAPLYARWEFLRNKYVGEYKIDDAENDLDRWRPIFAALRLYTRAISSAGMTSTNPVWPVIRDAAKKYNVKMTDVAYYPPINEPRAALNEFKKSRLADIDCFAKTVERIETDLEGMRLRANAWAKGDINAIRQLPATDQREACERALLNATFMKTLGVQNFDTQIEGIWLNAAEAALTKNRVTIATLPIAKMVSANGLLAKLKARGYAVQEPESATD